MECVRPISWRDVGDGLSGPVVECVYCDKQIVGSGNVVWQSPEGESPSSFEFAHKECDNANDPRHERFPLSEELDKWLLYLVTNAGVDVEAVRKQWFPEDNEAAG